MLYPYRASSARTACAGSSASWCPRRGAADRGEHAIQRTECLMEPRAGAELRVELRFLHAQRRIVQRRAPTAVHDPPTGSTCPTGSWWPGTRAWTNASTHPAIADLAGAASCLPLSRPARRRAAGPGRAPAGPWAGWCAAANASTACCG